MINKKNITADQESSKEKVNKVHLCCTECIGVNMAGI